MTPGLSLLRHVTQPLYHFRGVRRLPEWIRRRFSATERDVLIDDFDGDLKFHCYLNSHIGGFIFWKGNYSGEQLVVLDRLLRRDMVFFDIGANEGEHTVFAGKRVGRVVSFEPCSAVHDRLAANVRANGFANVTLVRKGLGEAPKRLPLYGTQERREDGSENCGMSTLHARSDVNRLIEEIEISTLDTWVREHPVDRIDFMKIDVEGNELAVLRGGKETIRRFKPVIVVEANETTCRAAGYSALALLEEVQSLGYRLEAIGKTGATHVIRPDYDGQYNDVICFPI